MDLPFSANQATPAWLGHPVTPPGTFAMLELPIVPPDADASLLVTVFFQEKSGGFLRIGWQGAQSAQVLSDNFYEGIGMSNQRSLLLSAETMKQSGALTFQCGDSTLGIQRIELQWLENQTGITSPAIQDVLVTGANGKTRLAAELNGQPPSANTAAWQDRVVNVPVTDAPLRIEQGVDFSVQMDSVPATARLAVKENGLGWDQHLVVWLNSQRAGTISPAVPDLGDGGYAGPGKTSVPYVGWREGTLLVPVTSLTAGVNTLQFSAESDAPTATDANTAPLAVKDVSFQLDYAALTTSSPAAVSTNVPAASSDSTPNSTNTATPDSTTVPPAANPAPSPVQLGLLSLPETNAP